MWGKKYRFGARCGGYGNGITSETDRYKQWRLQMAFTMPLAASIVFVGKWPRLQTKGQGAGPCPTSSFFVTFEIILNSAAL